MRKVNRVLDQVCEPCALVDDLTVFRLEARHAGKGHVREGGSVPLLDVLLKGQVGDEDDVIQPKDVRLRPPQLRRGGNSSHRRPEAGSVPRIDRRTGLDHDRPDGSVLLFQLEETVDRGSVGRRSKELERLPRGELGIPEVHREVLPGRAFRRVDLIR